MMHISKNSVVSIRYTMTNAKGLIIENTITNNPTCYLHGSSGIEPLLQAQLEGLKAGDKKAVYLKRESGLTTEDFIFEVIIDEVRAALTEEILLGYPVKLNPLKCDANCDCYEATS